MLVREQASHNVGEQETAVRRNERKKKKRTFFEIRVARAAAEEQHHPLVDEEDSDEEASRPRRVGFKIARNERRQDEEEAHERPHQGVEDRVEAGVLFENHRGVVRV